MKPDQPLRTIRFRIGQRHCCETRQPQSSCSHCSEAVRRDGDLPEALMVTKIDRDRGEVTLSVPPSRSGKAAG
jgi:hypothetical protein